MQIHKLTVGAIGAVILAGAIVVVLSYSDLSANSNSIPRLAPPAMPFPTTEIVENTIQRNATLVATLVDHDIPVNLANEVAGRINPVFDVRKLRSGNPFRLEREFNGTLKAFEYKIDDESILKVHRQEDSFAARVEKLDLEARETTIAADIRSTLWEALTDEAKGEYLVMELAEMFQWQVDFSNEIQTGDQVRLVVDAYFHNGNLVKYGKIKAAEFVNEGRHYRGFLFRDAYYDEKGVALKRAMLASPLKFTPRISSGFTRRRMHPILGRARAHLATDYAAPSGAPVVAVANGVVMTAGWSGGYGKFVQIRHANGLTSGYAHLSRIGAGVRAGQTIKQGELVGLVGSTGLSTGPHLHFIMTQNGVPINPVPTLKKGEPAPPLDGNLKAEFAKHIVPTQLKLAEQQAENQVATNLTQTPARQ